MTFDQDAVVRGELQQEQSAAPRQSNDLLHRNGLHGFKKSTGLLGVRVMGHIYRPGRACIHMIYC